MSVATDHRLVRSLLARDTEANVAAGCKQDDGVLCSYPTCLWAQMQLGGTTTHLSCSVPTGPPGAGIGRRRVLPHDARRS